MKTAAMPIAISSADGTSAASQIFASSEAAVGWKCSTSFPLCVQLMMCGRSIAIEASISERK